MIAPKQMYNNPEINKALEKFYALFWCFLTVIQQ